MKCDSKDHSKHMCAMKLQGLNECVREFSNNPTVECRYCGAQANSVKNLCSAHLIDQAPNVEGGHGHVSLEDVGMPHAGPHKED